MALSTTKADYVFACSASYEVVFLLKLLPDLFNLQLDVTCIYCDNKSCVKLSKNPMFHDKSKHIDIKYHYIGDMVHRGAMQLQYVATYENIVDLLTKPLERVKFEYFREKLGFILIDVLEKRE